MRTLFLLATFLAADAPKPPEIPVALRESFERHRANELESTVIHEADLRALNADIAEAQKICGEGFEVLRTSRNQPLSCVAKTVKSEK